MEESRKAIRPHASLDGVLNAHHNCDNLKAYWAEMGQLILPCWFVRESGCASGPLCCMRCRFSSYGRLASVIRAGQPQRKPRALRNWRLGNWATGQLGNWATGQLGSWATGQLGNWAAGRRGARSYPTQLS